MAWNPIANVKGPQGVKGDTGATGGVGAQGPQGLQGPAGSDASATTNAGDLTSGTLDFNRLPSRITSVTPAYRTSGGAVRSTAAPIPFGLESNYTAFPGACKLSDGRLLLVWRHGTDHATSRDGSIRASWSSDEGRTWTTPTTIVPYPGGGVDLRDPSVTQSADGSKVWLTYFKGTSSLAAAGCFLRTSTNGGATWSSESRIDPSHPYAAICAPLVEVGSTLFATWYGRTGSETRDSVWVARSTNGGSSWQTPTRVMNGPSAGRDYQEPFMVSDGSALVLAFRWGTADSIGISRSTNAGSSWSTGASAFTGTGRPSLGYMSTGVVVCSFRRAADGAAVHRSSRDGGVNWFSEETSMLVPGSGWMNYSALVEVSPGLMFHPITVDEGSLSKMWLNYVSDGAAISPVGDNFPDRISRVLHSLDQVVAADDFDRPNTSSGLGYCLTGQLWSAGGRIDNGVARAATPDNVVEFPVVETYTPNVTVEADFFYEGDPGFAMLLRYKDANNHFMFTVETGGTRIRFYVRNAGTYYNLVEVTTVTLTTGSWHKLVGEIRGTRFNGFVNGQNVIAYQISTADTSLLGASTQHGLKFNENSTVNKHLCRRFVVRS